MESEQLIAVAVIAKMNAITLRQTNRGGRTLSGFSISSHPLTCGRDSNHGNLYPLFEDGVVKLICPDCDYEQNAEALFGVRVVP